MLARVRGLSSVQHKDSNFCVKRPSERLSAGYCQVLKEHRSLTSFDSQNFKN